MGLFKKNIQRNTLVLTKEDKEKIQDFLKVDTSIDVIGINDIKCGDNEGLSIIGKFEDADFRNCGIGNKVMGVKPVHQEYFLNDLAKILKNTPYLQKYFDIN